MRIIKATIAVALTFAVGLATSQAEAVTVQDTRSVVQRALEVRGPEAVGPARPAVQVQDDAKSVTVAADGSAQTISAVDRANSMVRSLPDGGQVVTVLRSGNSARYKVDLAPGWRLHKAGPGFEITKPGTDLRGIVAAPWAIDAAGRQLRTWYESSGQEIVQYVDTTGARYPIAMDPKLTYGRGVYLNMFGFEVQATLAALIAMGGAAAYISCQGLAKLPVQVKKVVDILCKVSGAAAAVTIRSILNTLKSIGQINSHACYQKRIVPNWGDWKIVNGKNCR